MDKLTETAKETLERVRNDSINLGVTVYSDFVYLVHSTDAEIGTDAEIDFSNYGYLEYCLFADCLKLFENNGYEILTKLIDEVYQEEE